VEEKLLNEEGDHEKWSPFFVRFWCIKAAGNIDSPDFGWFLHFDRIKDL
jgi:hypothetical protein